MKPERRQSKKAKGKPTAKKVLKIDSSSDEDRPIRRKRKRKIGFFDDMAEDQDGNSTEDETTDDGDLSDFIDDSDIRNESNKNEKKELEKMKNKCAVLKYLQNLSTTELDTIGLSFVYSSLDEFFE